MPHRHRQAGLLLHPSSLPGGDGIGDFGAVAHQFAAWLAATGATIWQMLPLSPTGLDGSPYGSWSTFAGNPLLIALDDLVDLGVLSARELAVAREGHLAGPVDRVDFAAAHAFKAPLLARAATRLLADHAIRPQIQAFHDRQSWLSDHARFVGLRDGAQAGEREPAVQWLFDRQLQALRARCGDLGVQLFGDVPIYVGGDSVSVFAHPELFQLDAKGQPRAVSGVPPDAFSATGQRWGNPLYDWVEQGPALSRWWVRRLRRAFELADIVRIDHFRGLAAYWAIPAQDPDATAGEWRDGPGIALFDAVADKLGAVDIVAEDLGLIDEPVRTLKAAAGLPGMAILQFAFGAGDDADYLPHNQTAASVVYTGTHDNDTTMGWWRSAPEPVRDHVRRYLGVDGRDIVWDLIRTCLASVADRAIVPVQDLLGLGTEARMNTPAVGAGNWSWRLLPGQLNPRVARRFRDLAALYGRVGARR